MLRRVADIDGELRRFVASYVTRELEKPHVLDARMIDVSRAIDHAWKVISPEARAAASER